MSHKQICIHNTFWNGVVWSKNVLSKLKFFFQILFFQILFFQILFFKIFWIFDILLNKTSFEIIYFWKSFNRSNGLNYSETRLQQIPLDWENLFAITGVCYNQEMNFSSFNVCFFSWLSLLSFDLSDSFGKLPTKSLFIRWEMAIVIIWLMLIWFLASYISKFHLVEIFRLFSMSRRIIVRYNRGVVCYNQESWFRKYWKRTIDSNMFTITGSSL